MWNSFSKVIFSVLGVPLAGVFAGIAGTQNQYAGVAFCFGLVMVVGYFAHFKMFEGYEEKEDVTLEKKENAKGKTGLKDLIVSLIQNPPLIALLIACVSPYVYVFVTSGIAIYYFDYVVNLYYDLKFCKYYRFISLQETCEKNDCKKNIFSCISIYGNMFGNCIFKIQLRI